MARVVTEGATRTRALARSIYVQALAVYLVAQAVALTILTVMAAWHGAELIDYLTSWDAQWYLAIAEHGHLGVPAGEHADARGNFTRGITPLAFFPLYPWAISTAAGLPGVGLTAAALIVSATAGLIAACGITRLALLVDGRRRVALALVALWAGAPMAITLSMAYTEALFCALAAWALVGLLERRWMLTASCCMFAGWARPTASVLIGVVVLACLVAAWQNRDRGKAIACAAVAPLGLLSYWGLVATETGRLDGWMWIEETGWGTGVDWGERKLDFVVKVFAEGPSVMELGAVLALVGGAALLAHAIRQRLPWPLVAYGGGVLLLVALSSSLPMATARFVLPAMFVLLLPLARYLAAGSRASLLTGVGAWVLLGGWYSAYALAAWPFAI